LNASSPWKVDMPHDISRVKQPGQELTKTTPRSVPAGAATSSYQSTLLHIIETAANDPAGMRRVIYDLARMNLKQEIQVSRPVLTPAKARECLQALETAISRVESDLSRGEHIGGWFPQLPPLQSEPAEDATVSSQWLPAAPDSAKPGGDDAVPTWLIRSESDPIPLRTRERGPWLPGVEPPAFFRADRPQVEIVYPERDNSETVRLRRRAWRWLMVWPLAQLAGAVVLSTVLYLALTGNLHEVQPHLAAGDEISRGTPSGLPLPSSYGIYAISRGHLSELEALPIKAPDPRVALSAEINEPSKTLLSDGNVVFLVFRRDLLNSAPQKAMIRVVAKVARAMSFNGGTATTTDLKSSWRIRSNSYQFDVAPLGENREMVTIRPETTDFALPAGRYALVFNGQAYDFTIDGPVTDPAQCIESVTALNGPVYTDCRQN
jgi:hypothetical protein